jgi:hypothetical protein
MKMKKKSKIIYLITSVFILTIMLVGVSAAGNTITIVGFVNEDYQIADQKGAVFEVADSEKGDEVLELVGKQVKVTGNLMDADGTPIINVTLYEVIDD